MISEFYGFKGHPFSRDISTDSLYRIDSQREVLSRLQYAAEKKWFAVLTGECGSGKSTVIRQLMSSLDQRAYMCMYIADSKLTPRYFYNGLLSQLGMDGRFYRGDCKRILQRELEVLEITQRKTPVVIVDEAHLLTKDMLEELRFMLNVNADSKSPMALILAGQPELRATLSRQSFTAIRQRINIYCETKYLDLSQTSEYIAHQLKTAGYDHEIFSEKAVEEIYSYSNGSTREINNVCTSALMYGTVGRKKIIDDSDINRVIEGER